MSGRGGTEGEIMTTCQRYARIDLRAEWPGADHRIKTWLVFTAIRIGLALVFLPCVVAILLLVELYVIAEWMTLRFGAAVSCVGSRRATNGVRSALPTPWL